MSWIWMHIPLVEVIFTATAAMSLWVVIRYPESGAARRGRSPGVLAAVPASSHQPRHEQSLARAARAYRYPARCSGRG